MNKEIVKQYEIVRKSGLTGMHDYSRVMDVADIMGLEDLESLTESQYFHLFENYSAYAQQFN